MPVTFPLFFRYELSKTLYPAGKVYFLKEFRDFFKSDADLRTDKNAKYIQYLYIRKRRYPESDLYDETESLKMFDVAIIGAGVIGGMTARELTKYRLSVCILEKESDVACGASKANSGIVHGGYDPQPGTLKAKLNARGVPLLYKAAKELNVPCKNNGSMVIAFSKEEESVINGLYERGLKNGIKGMSLLSGAAARRLESNLSENVTKALLVTNAGIICPYELTIAAVGNAMDNGAELRTNYEVTAIVKADDGFRICSADGRQITARYLVNCAGGFADKIAETAGDKFFEIIPRAGEYMLLDKNEGGTVSHTIFQVPTAAGKGVLVTPTADGNLLLGPTAEQADAADNTETTAAGLKKVAELAKRSVPGVDTRAVITSFSGVRASEKNGDFIIKESEKVKGLIHAAAIDSPGLSSSAAIAEYIAEMLEKSGLELTENPAFNGSREDTRAFKKMSGEEKDEYIKKNPAYGRIVCRCETVSEGEILDALRRNPKATDIDGVKRRTRAGMGRCQGGFCMPYVMRLIEKETGKPLTEITKKGGKSNIVTGRL